MTLDTVTDAAGLAALRREWEELEERTDPPYYVRHHFVTAWWQSYSADPRFSLAVLHARHNGRLVAVAPLALQRRRVRGRDDTLLRWASHGDYLSFLVDPAVRSDKVCRDLLRHAEESLDWDTFSLGNVVAESPLAAYLFKSEQHNPRFKLHVENPFVDLTEYPDFDDFRRRQLPSHARYKRNKVLRELTPEFRVYAGNEGGIFERMAQLHQREKAFLVEVQSRQERHSLFEDPLRVGHYRPLYEGGHTLTFAYEDADGALLGYKSCFVDGRRLLYWNTAYAPDVAHLSVPTTLLWDIVAHLLRGERAFDVLDLGAGRYPWKFAWTGSFRPTYRLTVKREAPTPSAATTSGATPRTETVSRRPTPAGKPAHADVVPRLPWRATRAARSAVRAARSAVRRRSAPPVIWYVPHPDDETIFMGGSIHRVRDRRNILVLLTQGGSSSALAKVNARLLEPLTAEAFMAARLREMTAATDALGVRRRDVIRHDLPDGAVEEDAVLDIVREQAKEHPGAQHRTMSFTDPHRDHAAAGSALRRAHADGIVSDVVFHLPVPLAGSGRGKRAPLGKPDVAAKRRALLEYQVWDPTRERYAIGSTSVARLIEQQLERPTERVHGPDLESRR